MSSKNPVVSKNRRSNYPNWTVTITFNYFKENISYIYSVYLEIIVVVVYLFWHFFAAYVLFVLLYHLCFYSLCYTLVSHVLMRVISCLV